MGYADGFLAGEEGLGVIEAGGVVFLEDGEEVLVVVAAWLQELGVGVESVAGDEVEGLRVVLADALEQAAGGGDLALSREHGLGVEGQGQGPSHQLRRHDLVIILNAVALLGVHGPLATERAMPLVAGEEFVAVEGQGPPAGEEARKASPFTFFRLGAFPVHC